jgi:O-antigen/teichoic acid export membrane protein
MQNKSPREEMPSGVGNSDMIPGGGDAQVARNTAYTFATLLIILGLGLLSNVITARNLGPEGKGSLSLLMLIPTLACTLGSLGMDAAMIYFGGRQVSDRGRLLGNSVLFGAVAGIIYGALILLVMLFTGARFTRGHSISVLSIPLLIISQMFWAHFMSVGRFKVFNAMRIIHEAIWFSCIYFEYIAHRLSVEAAFLSWFLGLCISIVYGCCKLSTVSDLFRYDLKLFKKSLSFGIKTHLGSAAQYLNFRMDRVLVAGLLGVRLLGFYTVASSMAEVVQYLPGAVTFALFPAASQMSRENSNAHIGKVCRLMSVFLLASFVIGLLLGGFVIRTLFSEIYTPSLIPFYILLAASFPSAIKGILNTGLKAIGKPLAGSMCELSGTVVTVLSCWVGIYIAGIIGASCSAFLGYSVSMILMIWFFKRNCALSVSQILLPRAGDLAEIGSHLFRTRFRARPTPQP